MRSLIIFSFLIQFAFGKDDFTIKFLINYIDNENKPTHLIPSGLCWSQKLQIKLANEVSKIGTRCSSSTQNKPHYQDHNLLFLADLSCPQISEVLLNASSKNLFQFPYRWLILSSKDVDPVITKLWSCPILTGSDLVLAENTGHEFTLTELYRQSINNTILSTPRGHYNGTFVDTRPHKTLYRRRRDLMGHPLTMANVIQDSNDTKEHLLREDRLDLQNDAATKMCWMYAKHAFEMLNATRRHYFSYRYGYKVNGQWSGMINDIYNNKADFGTSCVIFAERLDVITYTDSAAPLQVRFVFRQPPLTYVSNIFYLPFSTKVWFASLVCVAASGITLYLISKWESSFKISSTQLDGGIGDALLLTVSAVAQQGCYIEPKKASGRIIEWVLFTVMMALYAAYSANIVVLLQAPSNSIRSLSQLAESKITLAANDVDYSRFVFKPYKDPTHVKIFKRIIPDNGPPEFYKIDEAVERIRQGLFAFHSIADPVYRRIEERFLETEKCDLTEVDFVNGFDAHIPVKKDSPYLEILKVAFKQIRESGIRSVLLKRMHVPKPRCSNNVHAFSSVGILDLRSVFIFMLYSIGVSWLILLAEILHFKLTRSWNKNKLINIE